MHVHVYTCVYYLSAVSLALSISLYVCDRCTDTVFDCNYTNADDTYSNVLLLCIAAQAQAPGCTSTHFMNAWLFQRGRKDTSRSKSWLHPNNHQAPCPPDVQV